MHCNCEGMWSLAGELLVDWEESEGLKAHTNVPHERGIRCHSHFLDVWCRHYKESSWRNIDESGSSGETANEDTSYMSTFYLCLQKMNLQIINCVN